MSKLSDTQAIILSAAAQRSDGNVLPLPGSLRGGAATKVVSALLTRGLIREEPIDSPAKADAALNTIWRNDEDGRAILLRITAAGLETIGVEPSGGADRSASAAPEAETGGEAGGATAPAAEPSAALVAAQAPVEAAQAEATQRAGAGRTDSPSSTGPLTAEHADEASASRPGQQRGKAREGTKQAALIAMLRRPEGATIAQIVEATGWQPHTVRGAFAGALKKKLGLTVTSQKVEDGARVYRIES